MAKLLIVDDSKNSRRAMSIVMTQMGHEIVEASNGYEALEIITYQRPDCMLLDILMPEMDGFEVLEVLHKRKTNLPVIMVTADIQETTRKKCLDLGAIAVINKPVKEQELQKTINVVMNTKS